MNTASPYYDDKHTMFLRFKRWFHRTERYLIPASLVVGLLSDFLMFRYVDVVFTFSLLGGYLIASALIIFFIHRVPLSPDPDIHTVIRYARLLAPLVLQYCFGALLSGFLIFYWFSGSLFGSWPFIAAIVILLVTNDLIKRYYLLTPVHIGAFFFIAMSYTALVFPYLLAEIEPWVFIVATSTAAIAVVAYVALLRHFIPRLREHTASLASVLVALFVFMQGLYFSNSIPPVPLALRDADVFHFIMKTAHGSYFVREEPQPLLSRLVFGNHISLVPGSAVFAFSSIFAPMDFSVPIYHHWRKQNDSSGEWESLGRIGFRVTGGRDQGYRGYTQKTNVSPGRWRIDIETERGQLIGRITLRVEKVDTPPPLIDGFR